MSESLDEKKLRRKQVALERQRKLRLDSFVKAALGTQEGREYFYWLLEICKVGVNPFAANALVTSFACGEMNVGQQVQSHLMEISPEGYLSMLKEKEDERRTRTSTADAEWTDGAAAPSGYDA
jgi:hypothetical protein